MFIGGGVGSGNTRLSDVWYSEDGISWTQATANVNWGGRYSGGTWEYNDKILIGGGIGATSLNDVWETEFKSYMRIEPSSTGQTFVFYNYTGLSPSHIQTIYNNAVNFSGTSELKTKPVLSIYNQQTSKTLTGNISAISLWI